MPHLPSSKSVHTPRAVHDALTASLSMRTFACFFIIIVAVAAVVLIIMKCSTGSSSSSSNTAAIAKITAKQHHQRPGTMSIAPQKGNILISCPTVKTSHNNIYFYFFYLLFARSSCFPASLCYIQAGGPTAGAQEKP